MTPECWFNSQVLRNIFHKKQLSMKTGRDVIGSLIPVTAVTGSTEVRPYPPPIAEITSGTLGGPR